MSIDTSEKRRSAIDFGKGPRGSGMPIPSGSIGVAPRSHILNLYSGTAYIVKKFFFWRNSVLQATGFVGRGIASTSWMKANDADEDRFVKPNDVSEG